MSVVADSCRFDVAAIGGAIVDIIADCDESFLETQGLSPGTMTLMDESQVDRLYESMGPALEMSGGAAANTMAGLASLGGRAAFTGKICADQAGSVFTHDIRAQGVHFTAPPMADGLSTARCLVLVTPDAQRTMGTYLGAAAALAPEDIDPDLYGSAAITYLEGYLWASPNARAALHKAAEAARQKNRLVAFSVSDTSCVAEFGDEFRRFIDECVDIVFANEAEACALYGGALDDVVASLRAAPQTWVITRSGQGSLIITEGAVTSVAAAPVATVVDTTGAGDIYAAGFLFALTRNRSIAECGAIASICAGEAISHYGARPMTSLAGLLPPAGTPL